MRFCLVKIVVTAKLLCLLYWPYLYFEWRRDCAVLRRKDGKPMVLGWQRDYYFWLVFIIPRRREDDEVKDAR